MPIAQLSLWIYVALKLLSVDLQGLTCMSRSLGNYACSIYSSMFGQS